MTVLLDVNFWNEFSGNILKAKLKGGVVCYYYQIYKHLKNRSRNLLGLAGILQ